jgi:radical SAM/Cys-rich protein
MDRDTAEAVLGLLQRHEIRTLDITGGAPELNPNFVMLAGEAGKLGCHVIVRSNLTVLSEPAHEHLFSFFAGQDLEITASLPCYSEANVDSMRGRGAFVRSIDVLRRLNAIGFGLGTGRRLNLVYNPGGAFLPPPQLMLERDYKRVLMQEYGIAFDRLFTFANMPIGRFRNRLERSGKFDQYVEQLRHSFNSCTLSGLMCRTMVSVGWDGRLYDCDFNQALGIPLSGDGPQHIRDFDPGRLTGRSIATGDHCFGCTAGEGFT